jgi:hypothetical protein
MPRPTRATERSRATRPLTRATQATSRRRSIRSAPRTTPHRRSATRRSVMRVSGAASRRLRRCAAARATATPSISAVRPTPSARGPAFSTVAWRPRTLSPMRARARFRYRHRPTSSSRFASTRAKTGCSSAKMTTTAPADRGAKRSPSSTTCSERVSLRRRFVVQRALVRKRRSARPFAISKNGLPGTLRGNAKLAVFE